MSKISVIMGVYASEKERLEKSIRSVLSQSERDLELIVVCDGTESLLPLLREWEEKDERVKTVFYPENKGLAFALNEGLKCATGEYIARQDDDDESEPYRLERQLNYLLSHPKTDFVCSAAAVFDDGGEYGEAVMAEQPQKKDFLYTCPFLHPTLFAKRACFERGGGYRVGWDTKKAEDYDLFMRWFSRGMIGVNLQERLYRYRFARGGKRRRSFLDRLGETFVRIKGFWKIKAGLIGVLYAFKPLLAWLLPQKAFVRAKRKYIQ